MQPQCIRVIRRAILQPPDSRLIRRVLQRLLQQLDQSSVLELDLASDKVGCFLLKRRDLFHGDVGDLRKALDEVRHQRMLARIGRRQLLRLGQRPAQHGDRRRGACRNIRLETSALVAHRLVHAIQPREPVIGIRARTHGRMQRHELGKVSIRAIGKGDDIRPRAAQFGIAIAMRIHGRHRAKHPDGDVPRALRLGAQRRRINPFQRRQLIEPVDPVALDRRAGAVVQQGAIFAAEQRLGQSHCLGCLGPAVGLVAPHLLHKGHKLGVRNDFRRRTCGQHSAREPQKQGLCWIFPRPGLHTIRSG